VRRAFVIALHDGFYSAATGAGLSNQALVATVVQRLPDGTDLVVLPVALEPTSPEYDRSAHQRSLAVLERIHHQVVPVDNGTGGQTRFGDLTAFQHLAKDTSRAIEDLTHVYDGGALLAIDRPFVGLGHHLSDDPSWTALYLPRSTARHHDDVDHTTWERHGLDGWVAGGAKIGAISTHMRALLERNGVPASLILDVPNGLIGTPVPLSAAPPIPPDATNGFLLAFGRAAPYKGFDDLLDAIEMLHAQAIPVPHLLLAAVTDTDEATTYQRYLAGRCATLPVTLWKRFDPGLPGLLRHPALRAVVVPSRVEPFGRIPLEAFTAGAGPVVATTAGGLTDTVIDGVTGYTAAPGDPTSLAGAVLRALTTDVQGIERMNAAGRELAAQREYSSTVVALVDRLLAPRR
jgi:glycosyltransferase involved in cell wall biosynthesis